MCAIPNYNVNSILLIRAASSQDAHINKKCLLCLRMPSLTCLVLSILSKAKNSRTNRESMYKQPEASNKPLFPQCFVTFK